MTDVSTVIESLMREVPDFPEPGIRFKDLTPVLADAGGLSALTDALAAVSTDIDLVAGVDARGFLLAAAVATRLRTGVLAVRKGGKLPPPVFSESYALEYGTATLEIPADGVDLAGRRVIVIDDVLATGGTVGATAQLISRLGATLIHVSVLIELSFLGGRDYLNSFGIADTSAVITV